MRRRDVIPLVAGAAGSPLGAWAQPIVTPIIGYLSALSESQAAFQLAAFRRGLNEAGFVEGQNVTIEFRWANEKVHARQTGLSVRMDDSEFDRVWYGHCSDEASKPVASGPEQVQEGGAT
jgi:hypothetical protein